MHIRPFHPTDLAKIQEITVESFEGVSIDRNIETRFGVIAGHGWKDRKARGIAMDCEMNPAGVFVAVDGDQIVGYITTRVDRFSGIGQIPNLAVAPEGRGRGIGSSLIEHALAWLRDQGMAMAKIETLDQNERGQQLYPRFGFQEVARQIHYLMPLTAAARVKEA
jgi:ribosomal protein S18 acetylase RimI-like enzyme